PSAALPAVAVVAGGLLTARAASPDRRGDDEPHHRPPRARRPLVGYDRPRRGRTGERTRSLPRPRRLSPVAAHEGRDDGTGLGAPLRARGHARRDARAAAPHDRARDLPRRVLSHEGARAASGIARPARALRRPRPLRPGCAAEPPRRRPQDREPRGHVRVRPARHLRRHARPPHLEPPRLRAHPDARADRARAPPPPPAASLDRTERPARLVRTEPLPADVAALLTLSGARILSAHRRAPRALT